MAASDEALGRGRSACPEDVVKKIGSTQTRPDDRPVTPIKMIKITVEGA